MEKLIDFTSKPLCTLFETLLKDRTTGENIIWATNAYSSYGAKYSERNNLTIDAFFGDTPIRLQPRIEKTLEEQKSRTRSKAEVFTPVWLCNQMNNYADTEWFGRENIFNTQNDDHTWIVNEDKIEFPKDKSWHDYILSSRLEITCGEAPYLVSRYDVATGELIEPPKRRIGLLDRKLRIVNEHTKSEKTWLDWAEKAYQSSYGYEYQGDSLIIARINLFLTFLDYYKERWDKDPKDETLEMIADIISWNIWQMDGFNDSVPLLQREKKIIKDQLEFDFGESSEESTIEYEPIPCRIKDWKSGKIQEYRELKGVEGK